MNYAEAVDHLYGLGPELAATGSGSRRKFDLNHMRMLCAELGDPQNRFPSVLIGGTNGKGSTAATLASILTVAGYRTALYTSPHLVRVNERIQVAHPTLPGEYGSASTHGADGPLQLSEIPDEDFASLYVLVDDACERLFAAGLLPVIPSFFERLTALAFLYFAGFAETACVQIAVLEVGLGGRLDATNVVDPLLSVITDISLDHQDYLGDTITLITREKCGILREGGTLITLPQHPEANQAIGEIAVERHVHGVSAADFLPPAERNGASTDYTLRRNQYKITATIDGKPTLLDVDSPLAGVHQRRNIALALAAAVELRESHGLTISQNALEEGVRQTNWPGRMERCAGNFLLDVAHNPAGAWALRAALASLPDEMPRTLIFSCLRDKNLAEMSRILFPLFDSSPGGDLNRVRDHVILVPIANPRAADVRDLLAAAKTLGVPAHAAPHVLAAVRQAREITPRDGLIVTTGSVYLVGEVRQILLEEEFQVKEHILA
jgi:dihydrofolate synthase/folylpolyglutamate synthase